MIKKIFNRINNFCTNKAKLIKSLTFSMVITLLTLIVLFNLYFVFTPNPENTPKMLFGLRPLAVLSNSMEPKLKYGDLIIVNSVPIKQLQKGDIVTFITDDGALITHRINQALKNGDASLFKTKGDANNVEDSGTVCAVNLVGKTVIVIPKLGYLSIFAGSQNGLIIIIVGIVLIYFLIAGVKYLILKIRRKQNMRPLEI